MKNQGFIDHGTGGNALVIILIMIALLGALTVTLTRMGQTGNDVTQEQASVQATRIARYMLSLKNGVDRLTSQGVSENNLCFDDPDFKNYGGASFYTSACDNPETKIFGMQGAGLKAVPANTLNAGSEWELYSEKVEGVGSDLPELWLQLWNIPLNLCIALNRLSNISPPAPQYDNSSGGSAFNGTYPIVSGAVLGDEWTALKGKFSGCRTNGSLYFYHQVLLAR